MTVTGRLFHTKCALPGYSHLAVIPVLTILLALTSCGFKLRGQVDIPPQLNPIYIEPAGSAVRNAIVEQLQGSQVQIAASPQQARVIVRISNESRTSRVTAVDRDAKVLARELHYGVRFDAVTPDGKVLVPPETIDVVRGLDNADVEVLGKQLEQDQLYTDMINDAANRILIRLRFALR